MKEGKVKFYNHTKGFGFIEPADKSEDLFVHKSGILGRISDDDKVSYEESPGQKGMNAINVKVIND
ncbi:cold-shock protein [Paracrocinitomix mangrovi]|uniref:cold-shock protein n=1 Tax=Paracrocinitomix mangrovi TaxID=2862509 RepID=UPI001C8D92BD|nr:cold-shock protein [Paracrocinitomix mangrovi]UKN02332.1 cold-shock protein [Paracrocinitomix mangrovi]